MLDLEFGLHAIESWTREVYICALGPLGWVCLFVWGCGPCKGPFIIGPWWAQWVQGIIGLVGGLSLDPNSERLDLAPN